VNDQISLETSGISDFDFLKNNVFRLDFSLTQDGRFDWHPLEFRIVVVVVVVVVSIDFFFHSFNSIICPPFYFWRIGLS
jgi:hypothetical protein